jgi:hypothetical protein
MISRGWDDAARVVAVSLRRLLLSCPEDARAGSGGAGAAAGGGGQRRRQLLARRAQAGQHTMRASKAGGRGGAAEGRDGSGAAKETPRGGGASARPPLHDLDLVHCPLLNASVCSATIGPPAPEGGLLVVVYNPLGSHRTGVVRLPVPSKREVRTWNVQGGRRRSSQLLRRGGWTARAALRRNCCRAAGVVVLRLSFHSGKAATVTTCRLLSLRTAALPPTP